MFVRLAIGALGLVQRFLLLRAQHGLHLLVRLRLGEQLLGVVLQLVDARLETLLVALPLIGHLLLGVIEIVLRLLVGQQPDLGGPVG
ncbi:hypothetical protein [Undibacterium sp. TJN19]|uniref:hypothetical protein n=1 Tax=Undibacterium sp. TJN19 TaxID=3413055 RepID=UPI003BF351D3